MEGDWSALLPRGARCRTAPVADVLADAPPARGERGEPLWPPGTVGSVTHAGGYRTVATVPAGEVAALGIDMELLAPLPPEVWPHFLDGDELGELMRRPAPQRGLHALSRWCLKEALFKALGGRIPFDALPLRLTGGEWRPAPALHDRLIGCVCAPDRLVLQDAATNGWQLAAAWVSSTA